MYQEEVYLTVYLIWIFQNKKGQVADGWCNTDIFLVYVILLYKLKFENTL